MAALFFDTSALVKYYHEEPGTYAVARLFAASDRQARISTLELVEAQAAFAVKVRSGEISKSAAGVLRARLMLDIAAGDLDVFVVTCEHFEIAARLIGRYSFTFRLRTLDALQLATATDLRRSQ